ncbi:MAG: DUF1080 domain-containing protein [Sediminibacterium sp.]|nr:DUF1080 domain-containing protein [Sediminibacterium sp.]
MLMKFKAGSLLVIIAVLFCFIGNSKTAIAPDLPKMQPDWISLFNGKDLTGFTSRGNAVWTVRDGVLFGEGGRGHIYADPVVKNFEIKGEFRITNKGKGANSGLYFRAHPQKDDPNSFPEGYEAQICNNQEASTGWLWKPATPTGKASALLTKDGEWFQMRVKAMGSLIQIWVKDSLVMTHADEEYKEGQFAIQCHNDHMLVEVRNLYYIPIK